MSAVERCLGSADGNALLEASRQLGIASVPRTPLITSADTFPVPQVAVVAGRALPLSTGAEVAALELMGAVGAEFVAMLSSEAQAAHMDEQVFLASAALRESGLGDAEATTLARPDPALATSAGSAPMVVLSPAAASVAQAAIERAGPDFSARHVVAALRRLGYDRIGDSVEACIPSCALAGDHATRPAKGSSTASGSDTHVMGSIDATDPLELHTREAGSSAEQF